MENAKKFLKAQGTFHEGIEAEIYFDLHLATNEDVSVSVAHREFITKKVNAWAIWINRQKEGFGVTQLSIAVTTLASFINGCR